jgi:hypothetical protein
MYDPCYVCMEGIEEAAAAVSIFGKTRALALALALDLALSLSLSLSR